MSEALTRLLLARTEGIGPVNHRRLMGRHVTPEAALAAVRRAGRHRLPDERALRRELAAMEELGAQFLFEGTPQYPPLLALLPDAPPMVAVLGDLAALQPRAVAMVGARNASASGQRFAEQLSRALAGEGIAIVSGLARGIDGAAHRGALAARGRTIAAIAGGLDVAYPPEHAELQERIAAEGGLLVTEAPLGTAPFARHFPRRNRLVAGLSLGVVVVEAMEKSGTLITARLALEYGRELYAVPGHPLEPRARGANDLLRQGARLAETAEDVLLHLPDTPSERPLFSPRALPTLPADSVPEPPPATGPAAQLLELLGTTPESVDELCRRCQLSVETVRAILLDLELEGRVQTLPGDRVARA